MVTWLGSLARGEFGRFFAVALLGLVIDVAVGTVLIVSLGFRDIPAAAVGLFAGMVSNYFLHLTWTFREAGRRASAGHFLIFAAGVAVTLAIRAAVLWSIEETGLQETMPAWLRLTVSAGVAFFLSYFINRNLVFHRGGRHDDM